MHGDLTLGGPLYWLLVGFMYLCGGLALFVVVDSLRARRAAAFAQRPAVRWLWVVPQAAYFALFVSGNIPGLAVPALATAFVLATPFAFAGQIAYLLRVVYPAPGRDAADDVREESAPQETTPGGE